MVRHCVIEAFLLGIEEGAWGITRMSRSSALAEAHSRYQGYRDAAFHLTWEEHAGRSENECDLHIKAIDRISILHAEANIAMKFCRSEGGFPWRLIWDQVRTTPRRFDVAIWDGPALCGLAVGMASRGKTNVTIKWLERFDSGENFLKGEVAQIVFTAADHYAKIVGAQWLKVRDPLPGTERLYNAMGFSVAPPMRRVAYYQREVS